MTLLVRALVLAAMFVPPAHARNDAALALDVAPGRALGPLSRIYRPSVMMAWADAEAVKAFLALPGPLGTLRVTLEPLLSGTGSLAEFRSRLAREGAGLKQLAARDATIVVVVARMPVWLASSRSNAPAGPHGYTVREASPTSDYAGMEALGRTVVSVLKGELGLTVLYEFWNEPESPAFWGGTSEQLFRAYDAFARGARSADPQAQVGGIAVGNWDKRRETAGAGSPPLLQSFIRHVAANRAPLSFVSWHNFMTHPEDGWTGAATVRGWLASSGLPADLPLYVTEWARWKSFPEWFDPPRDTAEGAAFYLAALPAIEFAGIAGHTLATLQDFNAPRPGEAFPGDFGLLTRQPMIRKASFCAMHMLARLDGQRIAVTDTAQRTAAEGVGAVATRGPRGLAVLVHRYGHDPLHAFFAALRASGVHARPEELKLSKPEIEGYVARRAPLPAGRASPAVRAALERARAALEYSRDHAARDLPLQLTIEGVPAQGDYRLYRVGGGECDPGAAYRAARKAGRPHTDALAAAREAEAFKPYAEGRGALPDITLPAQGAVLIEIAAAGRGTKS